MSSLLTASQLNFAYGELPESEKQYDRDLALETLKAVLALGHRIVAPDPSQGPKM